MFVPIKQSLPLIKQSETGITYQGDDFEIFYRNAGTISGDNATNPWEKIYLLAGEAKLVLDDIIEEVSAPGWFIFPANTYHSIEAHTDIIFLVFKK